MQRVSGFGATHPPTRSAFLAPSTPPTHFPGRAACSAAVWHGGLPCCTPQPRRRASPRRAAKLAAMESSAGADAPSAATPTPTAAALPAVAAPAGDRKRGRADWAEAEYKQNKTLRQREPDDAHEVSITVLDGVRRFVLADGVFVDLRQEAGTVYGTLFQAVELESPSSIDFMAGYLFTWEDSRKRQRRLVTVADYEAFKADVLARPVRARVALQPWICRLRARAAGCAAQRGVVGRYAARPNP